VKIQKMPPDWPVLKKKKEDEITSLTNPEE